MKPLRRLLPLCLVLLLTLSACTQDRTMAYNRAVALFAGGDFAGAAAAFERLGDYAQAPTYRAYSQGLVLYEQGQYAAAESFFEQTQDFMYGRQRYQYCHAHALLDASQFAEAASAFHALGEFEDAAAQEQYCLARRAEESKDYAAALFSYEASVPLHDAEDRLYNLQGQLYNRAIELKKDGQFESARFLFNLLGDYLSSAEQAVLCNETFLESQYTQADSLEASGDPQGAYEIFAALSSYRDAAARAKALADQLGLDIPDEWD